MKEYIGHPLQLRGAECFSLCGGKGDGMKYLSVRNGLGLALLISLDRCADLARVTFNGKNMGYFSPCGHVAPAYYDKDGAGFLKSFTAGFFTTCGLRAVGSPCTDEGEVLPLHGTIGNTPVDSYSVDEQDDAIVIKAVVRDCVIFGAKLVMQRTYTVSYKENAFTVSDTVTNEADVESPYMILYHCNMGYPLLSENSKVVVPNTSVTARNDHAQKYIDTALCMEKPTALYEERCYYYDVCEKDGRCTVGIFNPDISAGVVMNYNKKALPYFTQWKMMGKKDYVLGLEPGNCTPDGRDVLRKDGRLAFLSPDESATTEITFTFADSLSAFEGEF